MPSIICQHKSVRSARSRRRVKISDIWQWPGNNVLCFMGSPLRGQIDKLSFLRLVCGDWRTPAKNYNAFVVFMAPWFWLGAPWHRIVPRSMNWSLLRQNYQRRNLWRNLKKRFARAVNSLQELLTLFWTYSSVQIPAGRNILDCSWKESWASLSPDLMATDCFVKSLVLFVQNRHFSVRVENESTNLPVLRMSYMLSRTLENRLSLRKDSPNMTVEKRKTKKRMKRQESHVSIYAYPFSPHTKTGKCCTSWD